MNRPLLKRVFPQALAWTAVVALCGAMALGQDAATTTPATTTAAAPPSATATRTDGQIEMDVVKALDASKALKDDLITAATIQGEVTLSGTVSTEASSELAEAIASHVAGVTKVNNNLKIGNPQAAADASGSGGEPPAEGQPENPGNGPAESGPAPDAGPMAVPNQPQGQPQPVAPAPPAQPARPQYVPIRPPAQAEEAPKGPVTIPPETLLQLRTNESVSTKYAKDGTLVQFTVIRDVNTGGVLAIPRGATVHGVVAEVKKAGDLAGSPELALKLTSLDLGGKDYPLDTDLFKVKGPGKGGQTAGNAIAGGMIGTMIGCIAGRGVGCAIGAGAGVAAGTAASAATPGPNVWIPSEARVDFHLNKPLTVTPVSAQEATRLAQGLYQGGPNLYRRGYGPYGYPYYASYPYGYPPIYYRPYYVVGGYYYWR